LNSRQARIRDFCSERNIRFLLHFTRVSNVPSILKDGLRDRLSLEESRSAFVFNDKERLDCCNNAVCMSISFPNYRMFCSLRNELPRGTFAVLVLKAEVLWTYKCAFCIDNASSKLVGNISEEKFDVECLMSMFGDHPKNKRADLNIPSYFTTCPQAEVLVFPKIFLTDHSSQGCIHPTFISEIHVDDYTSANSIRQAWADPLKRNIIVNSQYFGPREDWKHWQKLNSQEYDPFADEFDPFADEFDPFADE
jgi:hypothetical protein